MLDPPLRGRLQRASADRRPGLGWLWLWLGWRWLALAGSGLALALAGWLASGWLAPRISAGFLDSRSGLDSARLRLAFAFGFHLLGFWMDLL